jgi:hypothetical protein
MDFCFSHDFDCTPEEYWAMFFDDKYNSELYLEREKMRERKELSRHEDESTLRRSIRYVPSARMPGFMEKVVKDLSYIEHSTYYKGKDYLDMTFEAPSMKERFRMSGKFTVVPLGTRKLRREFRGEVRVDIILLGKKIETAILENLRKSFEAGTRFSREWLARVSSPGEGR